MNKDTTLKIRLTTGELIAFSRLAHELGKSKSELLCEAIHEILKNGGKQSGHS